MVDFYSKELSLCHNKNLHSHSRNTSKHYSSKDKKDVSKKDIIFIGVFCEFYNTDFFQNTIALYNKYNKNLKWILCLIDNDVHFYHSLPKELPYIIFSSKEEAIKTCDLLFDIIIDYSISPNTIDHQNIIKKTKCWTFNVFNPKLLKNNDCYDATIIEKDIDTFLSPALNYKIDLPISETLSIPQYKLKHNSVYKFDIGFIGDNKYNTDFCQKMSTLSHQHKIVFIGVSNVLSLQKTLSKFNWNLNNITYTYCRSRQEFVTYIQKIKVIINDINYFDEISLITLIYGIPIMPQKNNFLLHKLLCSILKVTQCNELTYESPEDIINFIKNKDYKKLKKYRKKIAKNISKLPCFDHETYLDNLNINLRKAIKTLTLAKK